jgi:acetyl/propionyl-CoA carboxylase alpha subunit/acetyl-CoA carboxylase carboxyltransferase component
MTLRSLLVANRGEIAVRILRAAAELGMVTTAVYSADDADSIHIRRADNSRPLRGSGVAAYLDSEQILAAAEDAGCDAVHPGYGFLSEDAGFARRCRDRGITFVGPRTELLELFGDKSQGRALAERCGVPVPAGTNGPVSVDEARAFLVSLGHGAAIMIKAVAGGGGRGLRVVHDPRDVEDAYARCRSEARSAFGNGDVYVEQLLVRARHIEAQIVGDGTGAVSHLGERECTIQRRHQKLIEMAPCQWLSADLRAGLLSAAVRMAEAVSYDNVGTFEFLVDTSGETFAFIEANPRLQVEHTVTEEVTGVDLVKTQLALAGGRTLGQVGLLPSDVTPPRGLALQVRINMETMADDGATRPTGGTLTAFEVPSGPGIRVDTFGYAGYRTSPSFDSLLAKLIAHIPSGDVGEVATRAYRALCEFRIEGLVTNIPLLQNLLLHPDFVAGRVDTRFVEDHIGELVAPGAPHPRLWFDIGAGDGRAGAHIDPTDPLAVLDHGKTSRGAAAPRQGPSGALPIEAPVQGTVVSIDVREGDLVRVGQQLGVMEAMKMEHVVAAGTSGVVRRLAVAAGDTVYQGHPLLFIEQMEVEGLAKGAAEEADLDAVRRDLADVQHRHATGWDAARPDAVARRRASGQRTARENIADLCDPGSFVEYGPLVIAAQRRRRAVEELIERTPADGLVAGVGRVNGQQCVVMSYDYTVLAGTQGVQNHRKKDRMFELAERLRLPVVFFTEGGGGRPGDTDGAGVAGLDCMAFHLFGKLSGLVPLVGVVSGRCFAGNAALLGCCDVVIATGNANIGMGGPAMIEGGGLGVFHPADVGPMRVQVANGVVDVEVADEAEAVQAAKQYLSYFQGPVEGWECADQRRLRGIIPENRLRIYDVRSVIETVADTRSALELRRRFGPGMVTALVRIEGRPIGVIANNPSHLAGAIDSDGADKATRFMQLCDAFGLPLLFLCDTPGMMVGPEAEKTALVRHCCRMFVTGASLGVPFFTIILRKGYGLGAQAMAGGSFKAPLFTVAWPTAEFGGMGLEGAVKLGYRNELAAIDDPNQRKAMFDEMVARMYEHGKAINTATYFEIDDVIDPADSRRWITGALASAHPQPPSSAKRRPCVDTW